MSCCWFTNNNFMDELTQQERQLLFIDYYSHSILNEYINDGIISIIEKYINHDFEIITLKEQKQIRKEKRKEKCHHCYGACKTKLDDFCTFCFELSMLWIILIIIRIIINIVFIIISSIKIKNNN